MEKARYNIKVEKTVTTRETTDSPLEALRLLTDETRKPGRRYESVKVTVTAKYGDAVDLLKTLAGK